MFFFILSFSSPHYKTINYEQILTFPLPSSYSRSLPNGPSSRSRRFSRRLTQVMPWPAGPHERPGHRGHLAYLYLTLGYTSKGEQEPNVPEAGCKPKPLPLPSLFHLQHSLTNTFLPWGSGPWVSEWVSEGGREGGKRERECEWVSEWRREDINRR